MAFEIEVIPDADRLFHHVHKSMWIETEHRPSSACFKKRPALSVNWLKYSCVVHTRRPNSHAVISLFAGDCRKLSQAVVHSPLESDAPNGPNQAHADIKGEKPQSTADQMAKLALTEWLAA